MRDDHSGGRSGGPPGPLPWIARWLPRDARDDWFAPALADLRAESQRQQLGAGASPRRFRSLMRYQASVAWLFVESARLAAQEAARSLVHRDRTRHQPPRKDWFAMFFRDVRNGPANLPPRAGVCRRGRAHADARHRRQHRALRRRRSRVAAAAAVPRCRRWSCSSSIATWPPACPSRTSPWATSST